MNRISKRPVLQSIACLSMLSGLMLSGCMLVEQPFRFRGVYRAPKSGYQLEVIYQGLWDSGAEFTPELYKLAQICPLQPGQGRPIQFSISFQRGQPDSTLSGEAAGIPPQTWDWRTSAPAFQTILSRAGFTGDPAESAAIVRILDSGGGVYAGQTEAVTVVEAQQDHYPFDRTLPQQKWIDPSELQPCAGAL